MDKDLIFVVDDDASTRRLLSLWLEKVGYEVLNFEGGEECLRMIDKEPSAICLDIMMPGMDGIEVLKRIKKIDDDVPVIMITAQDRVDTAVETMREGAYDYLVKPIDKIRFETTVRKSLENYALIGEVKRIRRELKEKYEFGNIIGKSKKVQGLFEQIDKVLKTNITVLIEGETGTGKELVARAIHHNSARKHGPFIDINCGAIPENLQESEFFGFEKGSFTGAVHAKKGKVEMAHEGTLFLDEISDMGMSTQVKLLRFLQEKNLERIGGTKKIDVDVRVISATNKILKDAVREEKFRED
ncbi:MAG: sigma-54 dependent transcriptional regulator, partial [Candidatus Altiarchaeota archaeon]|nr:sigma-54 dependent transcriptional regulator [Candidatus Altiarchaeota archaeon]